MGILKINSEETWSSSRFLLHEVLEFVMQKTIDKELKNTLELCLIRNDSTFDFKNLGLAHQKIFYESVASMVKAEEADPGGKSVLDISALTRIIELRDKLKTTFENNIV